VRACACACASVCLNTHICDIYVYINIYSLPDTSGNFCDFHVLVRWYCVKANAPNVPGASFTDLDTAAAFTYYFFLVLHPFQLMSIW
jgi:hypothetical protein